MNCKKKVWEGIIRRGVPFCDERCYREFLKKFRENFGYEFGEKVADDIRRVM